MSQIAKELKKIQENREQRVDKVPIIKRSHLKTLWIATPLVVTAVAIFVIVIAMTKIESNKNDVRNLINTVKVQQKNINTLTVAINLIKKSSDAQISALNSRLDGVSKDLKIKMYSLDVTNGKIQNSVLEDKSQIDSLTKDLKRTAQEVEEMSKNIDHSKDIKTLK